MLATAPSTTVRLMTSIPAAPRRSVLMVSAMPTPIQSRLGSAVMFVNGTTASARDP